MSRSSPPPSTTDGEGPRVDLAANPGVANTAPSLRRKLNLRLAALMRWAHIYLSMFGLATILFFGVTGITLNHPDWFFGEADRSVQAHGQMNLKWLNLEAPAAGSSASSGATDGSPPVARLEIVEFLRT